MGTLLKFPLSPQDVVAALLCRSRAAKEGRLPVEEQHGWDLWPLWPVKCLLRKLWL